MSKKNYSELQYISTHSDKGGSFMKQMSEYKERQPKEWLTSSYDMQWIYEELVPTEFE